MVEFCKASATFACHSCSSIRGNVFLGKLVDPVVADPIIQDNDKRSKKGYAEIPCQNTPREGTKLPNVHILFILSNRVYRFPSFAPEQHMARKME